MRRTILIIMKVRERGLIIILDLRIKLMVTDRTYNKFNRNNNL